LSLPAHRTGLHSQQQPTRSIKDAVETLGFAGKNEGGERLIGVSQTVAFTEFGWKIGPISR